MSLLFYIKASIRPIPSHITCSLLGRPFLTFTCPMASNQPSYVSRILEDVVDLIAATITMDICFETKNIISGCTIKPSIAIDPPTVSISGKPEDLYTLVMTDPDAPSPSDPSLREWVHWIITDIPGGTSPTRGNEILPYVAPSPEAGIHRFVFILYKQKGRLGLVDPPPTREKFCTRAFARDLGLVAPVATAFFNAQREPLNRKRRAEDDLEEAELLHLVP